MFYSIDLYRAYKRLYSGQLNYKAPMLGLADCLFGKAESDVGIELLIVSRSMDVGHRFFFIINLLKCYFI